MNGSLTKKILLKGCLPFLTLLTVVACADTQSNGMSEVTAPTTPTTTLPSTPGLTTLSLNCKATSCGKSNSVTAETATVDDFKGTWEVADEGSKLTFTGVQGKSGLFNFEGSDKSTGQGTFLVGEGTVIVNINQSNSNLAFLKSGIQVYNLVKISTAAFTITTSVTPEQSQITELKCLSGCSFTDGISPLAIKVAQFKGQWKLNPVPEIDLTVTVAEDGSFTFVDAKQATGKGNIRLTSDILSLVFTESSNPYISVNSPLYFRMITAKNTSVTIQTLKSNEAVINPVGVQLTFACDVTSCGQAESVTPAQAKIANFVGTWKLESVPSIPIIFDVHADASFSFRDNSGGGGSGLFDVENGRATVRVLQSNSVFIAQGAFGLEILSVDQKQFTVKGVEATLQ